MISFLFTESIYTKIDSIEYQLLRVRKLILHASLSSDYSIDQYNYLNSTENIYMFIQYGNRDKISLKKHYIKLIEHRSIIYSLFKNYVDLNFLLKEIRQDRLKEIIKK